MKRGPTAAECRQRKAWKLFQIEGMLKNLSLMEGLTPEQAKSRNAALLDLRNLKALLTQGVTTL